MYNFDFYAALDRSSSVKRLPFKAYGIPNYAKNKQGLIVGKRYPITHTDGEWFYGPDGDRDFFVAAADKKNCNWKFYLVPEVRAKA